MLQNVCENKYYMFDKYIKSHSIAIVSYTSKSTSVFFDKKNLYNIINVLVLLFKYFSS